VIYWLLPFIPYLFFLDIKYFYAKQSVLHLAMIKSFMLWHHLFCTDAKLSLDLT